MTIAQLTDLISRNWPLATSLTANGWFLKRFLDIHKEQAALEAKISSFEERKSDSEKIHTERVSELKEEIVQLKQENLNMKKTIVDKHSDEAIRAKYDLDPRIGIATHKETKAIYCGKCLQLKPPIERRTLDEGENWRCAIEQAHHFEKEPGKHRRMTDALHEKRLRELREQGGFY